MTAKNLIVLGGGEDQIPAYVEGRRLGFRIIGVDMRADSLGAELADQYLVLTTRDPAAIARHLGDIDVAAVISPASDAAQASVAELSRMYRTPFQPAPRAVRASEDKALFRGILEKLAFPVYRHGDGSRSGDLRFPVFVKPVDSSGSKGLRRVEEPAELAGALACAREHSFSGTAIVEEAVEGQHYSVECFVRGGRTDFMAVTHRVHTGPPYMITISHFLPADLDEAVIDRLRDMIDRIVAAIGHRQGPLNLDFVIDESGEIYFIEMGARLGGNGMPLLVEHAFGLNTVEAAIRLALGEPFELKPTHRRNAVLHILTSAESGTLTAVSGLEEVRAMPGVVDVRVFKKPGDTVDIYTQASHKLGYLVVTADDRPELDRVLCAVTDTLRFDVGGAPISRRSAE